MPKIVVDGAEIRGFAGPQVVGAVLRSTAEVDIATYYEILGVEPTASPEQIRAAYLARARRLHPDQQRASPGTDEARAVRRMQRVNEAWTVLRDEQHRRDYDLTLSPHSRRVSGGGEPARPKARPAPTPPRPASRSRSEPESVPDTWFLWMVRVAPLLFVMAVLVVIFVVTAFARSEPGSTPGSGGPGIGDCVQLSGADLVPTPCDGSEDAQIVAYPDLGGSCPAGTLGRTLVDPQVVCLRPSG